MNSLPSTTTERIPEAQWLMNNTESQRSSFVLVSDVGELAIRHYIHAPEVEADRRRLGSYVHLGARSLHIDMEPALSGWSFSIQNTPRRASLEELAMATDALLHDTEPTLDPTTKGVRVLSPRVRFHPNQAALLENFDRYTLYEDAFILAINKPPNVSTHWDAPHHVGAAEIAQQWRGEKIGPVHRLDRLASGVLLFGKSKEQRANLSEQFRPEAAGSQQKIYIAIVEGDFGEPRYVECFLEQKEGRVVANEHGRSGKLAKTVIRKVADAKSASGDARSVVAVEILTGRKHQIRATLAHIDKPIVGDTLYNRDRTTGPMRLHAARLIITHPSTGQPLKISAPLPSDFFLGMKRSQSFT